MCLYSQGKVRNRRVHVEDSDWSSAWADTRAESVYFLETPTLTATSVIDKINSNFELSY